MTCAETCAATCTWRLTPSLRTWRRVCDRLLLAFQPASSPANEIRREQDEGLLKIDGRFGAHFEVVQGEDLLALFDAGLNRLPAVVLLEPLRQLLGYLLGTEVKQGAVLEGGARVEALE